MNNILVTPYSPFKSAYMLVYDSIGLSDENDVKYNSEIINMTT